MTSDVQARVPVVDQGSFIHSAGPANGLRDFNDLLPPTDSNPSGLAIMEASMGGMQNPGDLQNQQSCKYDLLSSIPRECELPFAVWF